MNHPPNAFAVDAISLMVIEHFLMIFNPDFLYLHDDWVGLYHYMVHIPTAALEKSDITLRDYT